MAAAQDHPHAAGVVPEQPARDVDVESAGKLELGGAGRLASATSQGDKKASDAEAEPKHPPVEAAVTADNKASGAGLPPLPPPAEVEDDDDDDEDDDDDDDADVSRDEDEEGSDSSGDEDEEGAASSKNEDEAAEDGSGSGPRGGDDDEGGHHILRRLRSAAGLVLLLGLGAGAAATLAFVATQPRYFDADHQGRSTDLDGVGVLHCGGADATNLAVPRYDCHPRGATSTASATPRPPHRLVVPRPLPAGPEQTLASADDYPRVSSGPMDWVGHHHRTGTGATPFAYNPGLSAERNANAALTFFAYMFVFGVFVALVAVHHMLR